MKGKDMKMKKMGAMFAVCCMTSVSFAGIEQDFPAGSVSIDLSRCQYSKAVGNSERLDPETFSQMKNSRFTAMGDAWQSEGVQFASGSAVLPEGAWMKNESVMAPLTKNVRYEAQVELKGTGKLEMAVGVLDREGRPVRPEKRRVFTLTGQPQILKHPVLALSGTARLTLSVRQISGKSEVSRADLLTVESLQWVSVRCLPAAITDNLFCVMENSPIPMSFQYRTARPGKANNPESFDLVLELPEGFKLWPGVHAQKISEQRDNGILTYRFRLKPNSIPGQFASHQTCGILIGTERKASERRFTLRYHLEYSGVKTEPYAMELKVIPGFSGRMPQVYRTGFWSTDDSLFRKESGAEVLADSIRNMGFNFIQHTAHSNAKDFSDVLKSRGIGTTVQDYFFQNGYTIGFGLKEMPDEVKFIGRDGKPLQFNSWHCNMCPAAIYTRSEFFNRNFLEYLAEKSRKYGFSTFFLENWEPFMFDDKGCFCPRCREEFIRYSGLPRETVERAWPDEMTGKYRKQWVKFRSWQHSKAIGAIQDGMHELSRKYGQEFVFCPAVGMGDLFAYSKFYDQYTVRDYIGRLDWLDPWGPYIFHNAASAYRYNIAVNYGTYRMARLIRERVEELCGEKIPHLLALPHAYQVRTWVTEPEAMAYETAAFFVNRWNASQLYVYTGLDGRYWRTMGELNNAIAQVDRFVAEGKKREDAAMIPVSPYPFPMAVYDQNCPTLAKDAAEIRKESPVTLDVYEWNGRILAALGNAWQRGEAFVKVKIPGLSAKNRYVVSVPARGVALADDYTAAELADGILLHVGALRFCFYVIEPVVPGRDYGVIAGRDALSGLLKKRLPEIRRIYEEDKTYAADFVQVSTYDFSQSPSLNAGRVSVSPKNGFTSSVLSVKTPFYSCELDMGAGGFITNYAVRGKTLLDAKSAAMRVGFTVPAPVVLNDAYEFAGWYAADNGAAVELKYKLGAREVAALKGLVVIKRFTFGEKNIQLHTEIRNDSAAPRTFGFRLHNALSLPDAAGSLTLNGSEKLSRRKTPVFHPAPGYDGTLFQAENGSVCRESSAVFSGKPGAVRISWKIPGFAGIYRWDSGSPVSSFEPASVPVTLQPGQSVNMDSTLE